MMSKNQDNYRFLFLNPPYERLKGLSLESVPLGLLSVATVLSEQGYETKVYDADTDFYQGNLDYTNINRALTQTNYVENLHNETHPAWRELEAVLEEYKPSVVGITMLTPTYHSCRKVVELIKKKTPSTTILVGGPHVTICPESIKDIPEIDFAFAGEAEESIQEFMEIFTSSGDYRQVKGLIFREKDGNMIFTGPRPRIENIDKLPIPDRGLLYYEHKYEPDKLGRMIASRGCPYDCAFCASVPLWKRKVKLRSPENLLKEIDYLVRNYSIKSFGFWDDTFTAYKRPVIEFCKLLYSKYGKNRFRWQCLANVNTLDEELIHSLKLSGCDEIQIGVESGSERILKRLNKRITKEQVRECARLIKKNRLYLHTFFMVGVPDETEEDIKETMNFIQELKPDSANLCTFTPYPGTALYDYVIKEGLLEVQPNFEIYKTIGHHSDKGFFLKDLSQQRYLELLKEMLELSSRMSQRLTLMKLRKKLTRLTWERVRNKLLKTIRKIIKR